MINGAVVPRQKRCRREHAVGKVSCRGIDARGQSRRFEDAEQWPQLMLNDQRVFVATACGGQQGRFSQQGGRVDQVKQVFKKSRVIPPFLTGCIRRIYAANFSFCAGVMPRMPMFGRSLL